MSAAARAYLLRNGPGVAGSAALHVLALLLVLLCMRQAAKPDTQLRTVLIDIVRIGTASSPEPGKTAAQAFARRAPTAHSPPSAVAPHAVKPPDDLQNRLNALAKLSQPETDTRALRGNGAARDGATQDGSAGSGDGAYSLKDFLRAQIVRRWNLDLDALGAQRIVVLLHVVMKSDGRILAAEIVDKRRYATDAQYRRIAMSARNAILLASPIALPAGDYPAETEVTLSLDPRDAMR